MGTATTPRHRAEVPRTVAWADLRRSVARLLAGRDLYADDAILRPAVVTAAARPDNRKRHHLEGGAYAG